ncbi:MAG: OmpA family protein, partial [Desulfuromonadales bacterium]|nr:OmpA family protein [Desulfuromonadales bacterium]
SPLLPGGGAIDLAAVPLAPGTLYHQGEPIFLRLTDLDQNRDPNAVETALVWVSSPETGDQELLRLYETAPDSGVFVGYLPTGNGGGTPWDGRLAVREGGSLSLRYVDPVDGSDVSVTGALVDPFGLLFDSETGLPVDGALITLLDLLTGAPAVVFGDDGVSRFPASVTSGGTVTDSGGTRYDFPAGSYRFPFVAPGNYRLSVQPPAGYLAPTEKTEGYLQSLPGAPFALVPGSRGEPFPVSPGPALHIDIPLDPVAATGLWLRKSSDRERVAVGDFLQYRVALDPPVGAIRQVQVTDYLPAGFRYRRGSATVNGTPVGEPTVTADGRTLLFALGDLAAGERQEIRYVVEVTAGARPGRAVNAATAVAEDGLVSNRTEASVRVEEPFFRSHSFIAGRVLTGGCEAQEPVAGLPGARLYLEDGTFVVTDEQGMYHFEGVRPGTHVVQLDLDSLPPQFEAVLCDANSRFAGRAYSQFVDLQGGTLWQADFRVGMRPKPRGEVSIELTAKLESDIVGLRVPVRVRQVGLSNLRLSVILPEGLVYLPGSSSLDGAPAADPAVTGPALTYRLGDAPAGQTVEIALRCRVTDGAEAGELTSRALLTFDSPEGKNQRTPVAETQLRRQVERAETVLPTFTLQTHFPVRGADLTVEDQANLQQLAADLKGLKITRLRVTGHTDNVPIAPQNRHYFADNDALSEARAKSVADYLTEFLALAPGQVEVAGRGETEPVASNATTEGRALNRRVEVRVECTRESLQASLLLSKGASGPQTATTVGPRPGEAPQEQRTPALGTPVYDQAWLAGAKPGLEWLWPTPGYGPPIPSIKVAVKHLPGQTVRLQLDGQPVNPFTFEGTVKNKTGTVLMSSWRGISVGEGSSRLEAIVTEADGREVVRLERLVHYSGPPVKAVLVPGQSRLVADGKTPPVIAVRLTDRDGYPAREGVVGEFLLDPPYLPWEKKAAVGRLVEEQDKRPQYQIGADGVALIQLDPTTRTGEAVVRFKLSDREQEVRAWLTPGSRDWILVGLAEGTVGYNTLSGNMESLPAGTDDELFEDGRLAFFAKGQVLGKWLLTAAYDSDKPSRRDESLFQTIDPDTYYTLYGDASQQGYEAPSSRKLYLKIERDQFYALFGDFDTGLTVTELSRYSRSFTGLKTELDTGRFALSAFASETAQGFVKEEIPGDGTSGLYRLSGKEIVINSEKVTIEARDRFRNDIIVSSRTLTRHIDYDIDYRAGTLFFKEPISSRDAAFN